MGRFINPFTDFGFKRIFGQEVNKDLLIDFLNQLLVGELEIQDLQFLNTEQIGDSPDSRTAVFDIYCKGSDGSRFIVEMQNATQEHFKERALYYTARSIVNQGRKGKGWSFELCPVYGVFLMNFKTKGGEKFRTDVILADRETGRPFNNKLRQIFLEFGYFTKEVDECETDYDRWFYLLKHMETLDRMPFKAQKAVFSKLLEVADVASLSQEERDRYDEELDYYRTYVSTIDYAKKQGIEEGLEQGVEKGIEQGKRQMAANMKRDGMDPQAIAKYSGLTLEEIKNL